MSLFNFRKKKAEEQPLQQERPIEPMQLTNYHTCLVCGKEKAIMYEVKNVGWVCKEHKDQYKLQQKEEAIKPPQDLSK